MSGGTISITLYPVGALVPMKQILESVGNRVIDIATVPEGYWHKNVPVSIIGQGLPFAFKDNMESNYFMFHKGFVDLLRKGYEKQNIYVIPYEPYNTGLMTKKAVLTDFDPVWFGILFIMNMEMGYLTPPCGFSLFYMKAIVPRDVSIGDIYKAIVPFVFLQALSLAIIIIFPEIALWLPKMLIN